MELARLMAWPEREGWNPGRYDYLAFYAQDHEGFWVAELDGQVVGMISAVRYGSSFGFIGLYIVKPEHRGRGIGMLLWNKALDQLKGRVIGLDGVVAQQANYAQSGFIWAYANQRFEGVRPMECSYSETHIRPLQSWSWDDIESVDLHHFGAPRTTFLRQWINNPASDSRGIVTATGLGGYGVIRPCSTGYKVGPLFALDSDDAQQILLALMSAVPAGSTVQIDVPLPNQEAVQLMSRLKFRAGFETARMYSGTPPTLPLHQIFGVTSFELG
jgi:GNAT superfamily N-acetyltransferase